MGYVREMKDPQYESMLTASHSSESRVMINAKSVDFQTTNKIFVVSTYFVYFLKVCRPSQPQAKLIFKPPSIQHPSNFSFNPILTYIPKRPSYTKLFTQYFCFVNLRSGVSTLTLQNLAP